MGQWRFSLVWVSALSYLTALTLSSEVWRQCTQCNSSIFFLTQMFELPSAIICIKTLFYQIRLVLDWGRGLLSNTGYPV